MAEEEGEGGGARGCCGGAAAAAGEVRLVVVGELAGDALEDDAVAPAAEGAPDAEHDDLGEEVGEEVEGQRGEGVDAVEGRLEGVEVRPRAAQRRAVGGHAVGEGGEEVAVPEGGVQRDHLHLQQALHRQRRELWRERGERGRRGDRKACFIEFILI